VIVPAPPRPWHNCGAVRLSHRDTRSLGDHPRYVEAASAMNSFETSVITPNLFGVVVVFASVGSDWISEPNSAVARRGAYDAICGADMRLTVRAGVHGR